MNLWEMMMVCNTVAILNDDDDGNGNGNGNDLRMKKIRIFPC